MTGCLHDDWMWLVEGDLWEEIPPASQGTRTKWVPLKRADQARLEAAVANMGQTPTRMVPVERGRYDVDLSSRTLKPVYWKQPPRRVLRSLWFSGEGEAVVPYDETDSESLEKKFMLVKAGKATLPVAVPVNKGMHSVRFEAMQETEIEGQGLMSNFLPLAMSGASPPTRKSVYGKASDDVARTTYEVQCAATQEAAHGLGASPSLPVWRGFTAAYGAVDDVDAEEKLPERVECLVFVVHGIGQYRRSKAAGANKFFKDVARIQKMTSQYLAQRQESGDALPGRLEFLPLEWYESIHVDVGIGNRLKNVTLPSVSALRDFANFAIADIMVYQDEEWQDRIHNEMRQKMAKLYARFKSRAVDFSGQVSVVGHSLGSVIMFDFIQKDVGGFNSGLLATGDAGPLTVPTDTGSSRPSSSSSSAATSRSSSLSREALAEGAASAQVEPLVGDELAPCPMPRCFFAVGSPLGMFMSIRLSRQGQRAPGFFRGLDVRWPASSAGRGWRFFNVFHPDDPIAYRIEPLLNRDYTDEPPRTVPHYGGLRLHHQFREWWKTAASKTKTLIDGSGTGAGLGEKTNSDVLLVHDGQDAGRRQSKDPKPYEKVTAIDRIDHVLQESAFESMNEFLSAISSHFAYWESEDLIHFIADQTLEAAVSMRRAHDAPADTP